MTRSDQELIEHPNALSSWTTIRLNREGIRTVLEVETDLILNAEHPDYNEPAVTNLINTVQAYMADHRHIDSADITRARNAKMAAKDVVLHSGICWRSHLGICRRYLWRSRYPHVLSVHWQFDQEEMWPMLCSCMPSSAAHPTKQGCESCSLRIDIMPLKHALV